MYTKNLSLILLSNVTFTLLMNSCTERTLKYLASKASVQSTSSFRAWPRKREYCHHVGAESQRDADPYGPGLPYLSFHMDKAVMRSHPKKPHSSVEKKVHALDGSRALLYYLERRKPFWLSPIFMATLDVLKGQAISSKRLSKWITLCISTCYQLAGEPLPLHVKLHSTRA